MLQKRQFMADSDWLTTRRRIREAIPRVMFEKTTLAPHATEQEALDQQTMALWDDESEENRNLAERHTNNEGKTARMKSFFLASSTGGQPHQFPATTCGETLCKKI